MRGFRGAGHAPGTFSFGNAIGKRSAMCDAAGMELWGYSITSGIGWLTTDQRTTNSVTKTATYQNNFAGSLATLTYPSNRVITYTQDGANRVSKAIDVPNSINYVTGTCLDGSDNLGVCYTPPGSLSSFLNGSSLVSTFYYNSRLQPCRISVKSSGTAPSTCTDAALGNVLDFTYNFNLGAGDNGNVVKITNNRDTTRSINYGYDSLNRIANAYTDGNLWGETYQIDPWGNLNKILAYTGKPQLENLNQSAGPNNQFTGMSYDAAGNLLNDGASNYVFDGENRITSGAGVTYTYDGDGRRVKKSSGKLYWHGMGSDPLDETDLSGNLTNEYIFFAGKRIARRDPSNNVFYYFADHLGTSRVLFQSGQTSACYDADFYPYGVERTPVINSCSQNYKFTSKERDSESGLDNFGARHDSSTLGRFMSPDVGNAYAINPQSWNRYTYVLNNPLFYVDPDGQEPQSAQTTTITMPIGTLFQPHWHEIGDPVGLPPIPNGKLGKDADAAALFETQLNWQYDGTDVTIFTVTFTTISVNGSFGNPVTGEGAFCSAATHECTVATITESRFAGPSLDARPGTVRQFAFRDPNESTWTHLNLWAMSPEQLAALRVKAQKEHRIELVRLIDEELEKRRKQEEEEERKRKRKKQ